MKSKTLHFYIIPVIRTIRLQTKSLGFFFIDNYTYVMHANVYEYYFLFL